MSRNWKHLSITGKKKHSVSSETLPCLPKDFQKTKKKSPTMPISDGRRRLCVIILTFLFAVHSTTRAWTQCSEEDGGGQCPDMATCCPTDTPGVSSCIPNNFHIAQSQGVCCDATTGCGTGYECAVQPVGTNNKNNNGVPYCKLKEEDHPLAAKHDAPRYELCTVPREMRHYHGLAVESSSSSDGKKHQFAYLSNMGPIDIVSTEHLYVEDVLIILHGSLRDADDYFCAGLSIAPSPNTLIIAPRFATEQERDLIENELIWGGKNTDAHGWRYGADAFNAPVSPFEFFDIVVEHIVQATVQFPYLQRISVAGHSAGGQLTHRWALLSNIPAWDSLIDIRAIVANPRNFCYLDDRRIDSQGTFEVPPLIDINKCRNYNQWRAGLEPSDAFLCPYKDRALAEAPGLRERYATRKVIYLSGEYDTEEKKDLCETVKFQGKNRQVRSERYFQALEAYFGKPVHERHVIPGSPHDHFLMFQSKVGRKAIFGRPDRYDIGTWDDC